MGTRADFYVGRGADAEWIGSIAWDGYPEGIIPRGEHKAPRWPGGREYHVDETWPAGEGLFDAQSEPEFRSRLERFFLHRDDVTRPNHGWPWPWETSHTTDFAYAFDGGCVWASKFGCEWWPAAEEVPEGDRPAMSGDAFPDMSRVQNVTLGKRSGVIAIGVSSEGGDS